MAKLRSVCVYCGSSSRVPEAHKQAARRLGELLGRERIRLIYGGGRIGLMGIVADAALESGGEVIGIIPQFLEAIELGHPSATELVVTESMHARKQKMAEQSDAFVVLPGGLGTLDETFEIMTWRQLGLHDKPIVVVDAEGYWQPLSALINHMVAHGYARPENAALIQYVPSVEEVLPTLARLPESHPPAHPKWL
jgi:uncharacterized protein (TIGR00730 family)